MKLWDALADLVFPPHCPGCASMLPPSALACEPCSQSLEPLDAHTCCPRCLDTLGQGQLCGRCRANPPAFEQVHAGLLYGGLIKDAIHRLKFQSAAWVAAPLAQLAWPKVLPQLAHLQVLVPVPLHPRRHRERGYNQAQRVALALARRLKVPVAAHALVRVKATAPVASLHVDERAAMVANAFAMGNTKILAGRVVGLVDDVVTTSATVRACALVLRAAGAARVDVVCLARGGHGAEV